jgi:hypothetical protein
LRKWFRNDRKVLKEIDGCPTTPFTSTIQETFDEINVTTKDDSIIVSYKANGINMREEDVWKWSEKIIFKKETDSIKIIKRKKSKVKSEKMKLSGEE